MSTLRCTTLLYCLFPFCAFLFFCSDWPTSFEQITSEGERHLDFIFRNAADTTLCEAMPGDTMLLYAYFGGPQVRSIQWDVSFDVVTYINGRDSALDTKPLVYAAVDAPMKGFTGNTHGYGLKFVVPREILTASTNLKNNDSLFAAIGLPRPVLLGILDTLTKIDTAQWKTNPLVQLYWPQLEAALPLILQLSSTKVKVRANVNGIYRSFEYFTVRYNRYFARLGLAFANHNPAINFMALYKVKARVDNAPFKVSTMTKDDTTYCLYLSDTTALGLLGLNVVVRDTIVIDTNSSYYLLSDTGVFNGVSQLDLCRSTAGSIAPEVFSPLWFYQTEKSQSDGLPKNKSINLFPVGSYLWMMQPPKSKSVTTVSLWVQLFDDFSGEYLRPSASALREKKIYFTHVW